MRDAVSEWLAAARHRFLVGYARSVIDSVGPAGAEFARIAEYLLFPAWLSALGHEYRSSNSARQCSVGCCRTWAEVRLKAVDTELASEV
jgi:hypothetical protein